MDMETSDDEEEDGQISKYEEQEERDRKLFDKANVKDEPVTLEDIEKCRLSRDSLEKFCMAPWFEDFVKGLFIDVHAQTSLLMRCMYAGAWVRYLIGQQDGQPVYRMCEVISEYRLVHAVCSVFILFKTLARIL